MTTESIDLSGMVRSSAWCVSCVLLEVRRDSVRQKKDHDREWLWELVDAVKAMVKLGILKEDDSRYIIQASSDVQPSRLVRYEVHRIYA